MPQPRPPILIWGLWLILPAFPVAVRGEHPAIPAGVACQDCHPDVANRTTAARAGPRGLRFNHKLHLAMGNVAPILAAAIDKKRYLATDGPAVRPLLNTQNACQACHRRLDQRAISHLPRMADCLVCHNKIDNPFSCEKCHSVPPAQLKPASHTADYVDTHSSGKLKLDKPSCVPCHGVDFRCLGCH